MRLFHALCLPRSGPLCCSDTALGSVFMETTRRSSCPTVTPDLGVPGLPTASRLTLPAGPVGVCRLTRELPLSRPVPLTVVSLGPCAQPLAPQAVPTEPLSVRGPFRALL